MSSNLFDSPSPSLTNFIVRLTSGKTCPTSGKCSYTFEFWARDPRTNKPVQVKNDDVIRQLQSIGMPPGYKKTYYNLDPNADILAIGIDKAGRKQYRYKASAIEEHANEKFNRMIPFIDAIQVIRKDIDDTLSKVSIKSPKFDEDVIIAMAIKLMDIGHFRIGSDQYREEHDSFGVSNLMPKHLHLVKKSKTLYIAFKGKSGVKNELSLSLSLPFTSLLWKLKLDAEQHESDHLFHWLNDDSLSKSQSLRSHHINDFIQQYGPFSAKDFRTYSANVELLKCLLPWASSNDPAMSTLKQRKSILKDCVSSVAALLHHTVSNSRKAYMYPLIINMFEKAPEILGQIYESVKGPKKNSIDTTFAALLRG